MYKQECKVNDVCQCPFMHAVQKQVHIVLAFLFFFFYLNSVSLVSWVEFALYLPSRTVYKLGLIGFSFKKVMLQGQVLALNSESGWSSSPLLLGQIVPVALFIFIFLALGAEDSIDLGWNRTQFSILWMTYYAWLWILVVVLIKLCVLEVCLTCISSTLKSRFSELVI